MLYFTVIEVRTYQSLCLKFLIKEHLICCAKISALKVILSGAMSQEEVIWYSILQIAFINSYDRWKQIKNLLTIFSYSYYSFSA
jgi:Na+/alanine symporter